MCAGLAGLLGAKNAEPHPVYHRANSCAASLAPQSSGREDSFSQPRLLGVLTTQAQTHRNGGSPMSLIGWA